VMGDRVRAMRLVATVVALLLFGMAGQFAAFAAAPDVAPGGIASAVGSAGSSYLHGLRTFAAATLWNRIDPLLHGYYEDVPLVEQRYMLSSLTLIMWLDPQFEQAYYIGAWILARNDRIAEGLEVAERGVEANPRSGLLLMNHAQVLMLYGDDLPRAATVAEQALDSETVWADASSQHNAYPILGAIFRAVGRDDLDAVVQAELVRLDAELHDHDHDGVPDH